MNVSTFHLSHSIDASKEDGTLGHLVNDDLNLVWNSFLVSSNKWHL